MRPRPSTCSADVENVSMAEGVWDMRLGLGQGLWTERKRKKEKGKRKKRFSWRHRWCVNVVSPGSSFPPPHQLLRQLPGVKVRELRQKGHHHAPFLGHDGCGVNLFAVDRASDPHPTQLLERSGGGGGGGGAVRCSDIGRRGRDSSGTPEGEAERRPAAARCAPGALGGGSAGGGHVSGGAAEGRHRARDVAEWDKTQVMTSVMRCEMREVG